ncbi:MAG: signal peptidase I [Desulfuromonas sp.]|nr:MAG: signal peptidase I [Desulfuromonas sp.]
MKLFGKKPPEENQVIKPKKPWYREYGEALIIAGILAIILRTFVIQAFKIPSGSMEETLLIGDHLLVNKFIYGSQVPLFDDRILRIRHPERGDVIVFEFPGDADKSYFNRRDFIKRVVGTPGDKVEVRNKKVFVNGERLAFEQEIHRDPNIVGPGYGPRDNMPMVTVPPESYFVMGDNRDQSFDSRFWGFVPENNIKGLAFIKYWSWNSEETMPRFNRIGRLIE